MAITLWRPTRSLSAFPWDLTNWLDDFFETENTLPRVDWGNGYRPSMESYIKDNELHLRAEIPGVDPKDVTISLKDGHLCISGERKRTNSGEDACYCFEEMSYGEFSCCFHVPRDIDAEKIHARYNHGMLELTVPLKEPVEGKTIPIEGVKEEKKAVKAA